jgi:hypothetical protein
VRESRPCENRPCASDGNVVLNMLHKQNHAQDEWARLALHGACMVQMPAQPAVRVTPMWACGHVGRGRRTYTVQATSRRRRQKLTREERLAQICREPHHRRRGRGGKRRVGNIA